MLISCRMPILDGKLVHREGKFKVSIVASMLSSEVNNAKPMYYPMKTKSEETQIAKMRIMGHEAGPFFFHFHGVF